MLQLGVQSQHFRVAFGFKLFHSLAELGNLHSDQNFVARVVNGTGFSAVIRSWNFWSTVAAIGDGGGGDGGGGGGGGDGGGDGFDLESGETQFGINSH